MRPAIKTQVDRKKQEADSAAAVFVLDENDRGPRGERGDMTRQEHKEEADVNTILRRFEQSGTTQQKTGGTYGEVDYTIDLQQAYSAIEAAKMSWARAPEAMKKKYGSYQNLVAAIEDGTYARELSAYNEQRKKENEEAARAKETPEPQKGEPAKN